MTSSGAQLFYKQWLPEDGEVRAMVLYLHRYADTCTYSWEGERRPPLTVRSKLSSDHQECVLLRVLLWYAEPSCDGPGGPLAMQGSSALAGGIGVGGLGPTPTPMLSCSPSFFFAPLKTSPHPARLRFCRCAFPHAAESAIKLAQSHYLVLGLDYEGFGLSSGIHGYIPSFKALVDDVVDFTDALQGEAQRLPGMQLLLLALEAAAAPCPVPPFSLPLSLYIPYCSYHCAPPSAL